MRKQQILEEKHVSIWSFLTTTGEIIAGVKTDLDVGAIYVEQKILSS